MICFIKSTADFAETLQKNAIDYDLTLDSAKSEQSTVTIDMEDMAQSLLGKWVVINGAVYKIDKVTPATRGKKTTLKLLPPESVFDRKMLYTESAAKCVGAFIAEQITAEWINQTDPMYALPYISIANADTTVFEPPEVDDNGLYNLLDYIDKARADYGVSIHARAVGGVLALIISKDIQRTHYLALNDGHTQLISADFSGSALAKLTVYQKEDTGEKDEEDKTIYRTISSTWYLASDGSVSSSVPASRASGEWGTITIGENDDAQEKAKEQFAKNEDAHKVEFYSDKLMSVGDTVKMRLAGELFSGQITGIYRKRGDSRTRYKVGNMITTLTERVDRRT